MLMHELIEEASRQLTICNACRYCEGYCPVFPVLETRHQVTKGDVVFLAHLCHDCRACFYACMYAPPHDFAVNLPKVLSTVRVESYRDWSWPSILGRAFIDRRVSNALALFSTIIVIILSLTFVGPRRLFSVHTGPGAFYAVIPFFVMVVPAFALVFYSAAVWANGGLHFWREVDETFGGDGGMRGFARAMSDALTLKWLRGGGPGCFYPGTEPSSIRRIYHSFVFYGFLAALISTILAAIYQEIFHIIPPYPVLSAPVLFGAVGGMAMIVGAAGLISIKMKSDPDPAGIGVPKLDYLFLVMLGLGSLSGMLTLVLRTTRAMGLTLSIHLGLVAALFVTAPYGKFIHSMYRSLALMFHRVAEERAARSADGSASHKA
jgi:citrate/tricarballylate utilization protein